MAFARRLFFLLCGMSGLLTGVWSFKKVQTKDNNCPKGWTRLDCHCYIYQPHGRTFADAESICNILDANLVSIHSALENAFVLELASAGGNTKPFWIGLHDAIEIGEFIWTNGKINDFDNFDEGAVPPQPDSLFGACIEVVESTGQWQTQSCAAEYGYVCIRDVLH
ncbi:C-type lectin domain family 19 member A-like [Festucalex cinctus]